MNYFMSIDEFTNYIIFSNEKYMWTIEEASGVYHLYQYIRSLDKEYYVMHDKDIKVLIDFISKEK